MYLKYIQKYLTPALDNTPNYYTYAKLSVTLAIFNCVAEKVISLRINVSHFWMVKMLNNKINKDLDPKDEEKSYAAIKIGQFTFFYQKY